MNNEFLIEISNQKLIIITVGDTNNLPNDIDLCKVRDLYYTYKDHLDCADKIRAQCVYPIKYDVYLPGKSGTEYVLRIISERIISLSDIDRWVAVVRKCEEVGEMVFFIWGALDVKRINKNLIPFT